MNAKPIVAILCFTAGCLAATIIFTSYGTAQTDAPEPPDTGSSPSRESIRVRYARTYLELAKTDLDIALNMNKRVRGTYPENIVQRLQNHVEIAEMKLQYEISGGKMKLHDIHLRELEGTRKLAEMNLASAQAVNKHLSGAVSKQEIQRLRLLAEVAKLAIAKGHDPVEVSSPYSHVQWQLEQLQSELLWLHIRSEYPH